MGLFLKKRVEMPDKIILGKSLSEISIGEKKLYTSKDIYA